MSALAERYAADTVALALTETSDTRCRWCRTTDDHTDSCPIYRGDYSVLDEPAERPW